MKEGEAMQHQAFCLLPPNLGILSRLEEGEITLYLRGWVGRRAIPFGRVDYILGKTGEETVVHVDVGPPENFIG